MRIRRVDTCARCGRRRPLRARKMCGSCNTITGRTGERIDYPRARRTAEELVEEVEHLTRAGICMEEISDRLGYASVASLEGRIRAARRRAYVASLEAEVRFLRTRVAELQARGGVR